MRMSERRKRVQRTYLGLPSSGVPDLKGKQEHSQQRTQVQNTGIRLGVRRIQDHGVWDAQTKRRTGSSNTAFSPCCLDAA